MEKSNFISRFVVIIITLFFAICGLFLFYFIGGFSKIYSTFYPEKTQFSSVYKLNASQTQDLLFTINRGMQIVGNQLPGKEDFFDDIIPLDKDGKSIALSTSSQPEVTYVRYKKGVMNLDMFYDPFIKEKMGYKKWNYAIITFSYDENKFKDNSTYNKKNGGTVEIAWSKEEIEQALRLKFTHTEEKILYQSFKSQDSYHDGIVRKYYFISLLDPKIHVNFISAIIDVNKVTTGSDYPKFFAGVEIYKEDDERKQILAEEQKNEEQAEQAKREEEKRKQQERKEEAFKQLGIQE